MRLIASLAAVALLISAREGSAQLVTTDLLAEYRGESLGELGIVDMRVISTDGVPTDLTGGVVDNLRALGGSRIEGRNVADPGVVDQPFITAGCTVKEWIPGSAPTRVHWMILIEVSWWNPSDEIFVELWEQMKQGYMGTAALDVERYHQNCAVDVAGVLIELGL